MMSRPSTAARIAYYVARAGLLVISAMLITAGIRALIVSHCGA